MGEKPKLAFNIISFEILSNKNIIPPSNTIFFFFLIFLLISYQTCLSKLFPHILCLCTLFLYTFIYLYFSFLAALGLCCCVQAFSSCGEQGPLFVAVRRLLTAVASLVEEHGALGARASVVAARGL